MNQYRLYFLNRNVDKAKGRECTIGKGRFNIVGEPRYPFTWSNLAVADELERVSPSGVCFVPRPSDAHWSFPQAPRMSAGHPYLGTGVLTNDPPVGTDEAS